MNDNNVSQQAFDFGCAYMQTLPHTKNHEEFDTNEAYSEYLNQRREIFFNEYLAAVSYAHEQFKELQTSNDDVQD
ncbi:hypothetical protein [Mammaliicoccus sciuri]|uniref:hypothetical protein n=1 Tax=Mammaliicoccus sciuri TaxID=1296 RepID=UPI003F55E52D